MEEDGEGGDDGGDSGAVIEDLVPRNNIAAQLTPEFLDMIKVHVYYFYKIYLFIKSVY